MTGYYKILPYSPSRYIGLREAIKKYYEVIEIKGEWLAVPYPQDEMFERTVIIQDPRAKMWTTINDPIDVRDLEQAIERARED